MLSNHALTTVAAVTEIIGEDADDRSAVIEAFINQASRLIQNYCGREMSPQVNSQLRKFEYDGSGYLDLGTNDLRSVDSITVIPVSSPYAGQTPTVITDYLLMPLNSDTGTYTSIRMPNTAYAAYGYGGHVTYIVSIVGDWGWETIPDDIERACIRTVEHWFNTEVLMQAPSSPDMPLPSMNLPFDVRNILNHYKRVRIG